MRFSLSWLFIAILCLAVSMAALLNANPFWVGTLRSAVVVALSLGIASIIASKGSTRFFSIGFVIVGWVYFLSGILDYYPPFRDASLAGVMFPLLPHVRPVFHCILTATFAVIGGFATVWLYEREDRRIISVLGGRQDGTRRDRTADQI